MSDTLKLENQLCHRLYLLSNAFTRAYRPLLDEIDITYPQYIVLMALWEKDEISIASLNQKTGIDAGAMTLILRKLSQKGFLDIRKDKADKRVKYVFLTEVGRELKEKARSIPEQMRCRVNDMQAEELQMLALLLDKLKSNF